MSHTIGLRSDFHSGPDPLPSRAELARDDAAPPDRQIRRNGHGLVSRYTYPPEPYDHLAFDRDTTLCGEPFHFAVVRSAHPTCPECVEVADQ